MLVRVDPKLRMAVLQAGSPVIEKRSDPESFITVVTGDGVQRIKVQNEVRAQKREEAEQQELSDVADLIPDWIKEALVEGEVLVMPKEDFYQIPPEVTDYLDILSY